MTEPETFLAWLTRAHPECQNADPMSGHLRFGAEVWRARDAAAKELREALRAYRAEHDTRYQPSLCCCKICKWVKPLLGRLGSEAQLPTATREELQRAMQALINRVCKLPKRFPTDLEWDEVVEAERLLKL